MTKGQHPTMDVAAMQAKCACTEPAPILDMSPPEASIIIVNYNGRAYLERCLNSLCADQSISCEIIVVDNASTDDSVAYLAQAFPQVRVIQNSVNGGFGQGNNLGAQQAEGRYLVFLNPDTTIEPGWLGPLITTLQDDPRVGLVTSKILLMNAPDRINTCGNAIHYTGLTLCRGMGEHHRAYPNRAEVAAVSGAAFAIRKELFEALGGFDELFFMYMEDTELSLRARLAGYPCAYIPTSVVYHDYQLTFGPLKTFYQERNRYLMLLKHFKWQTLLVLLPAFFAAELITWGFALLNDRQHLSNKLCAYQWIVSHRAQIIQARQRSREMRKVKDRDLLAHHTYRLAFEQADRGIVSRVAHLTFDPFFYLFQRLAWVFIQW